MAVGEDSGAELRELEQDWSQLGAKDIHGGEKFFQLGVAVREDFVVGDGTRGLGTVKQSRTRVLRFHSLRVNT